MQPAPSLLGSLDSASAWAACASSASRVPASLPSLTVPGVAADVTARLHAILHGRFILAAPSGAEVPGASLAAQLGAAARDSRAALAAAAGKRWDAVWWGAPAPQSVAQQPAAAGRRGGQLLVGSFAVRRDASVRLYSREEVAAQAAMLREGGRGSTTVEAGPSAGHFCVVDPKVFPTADGKPAMDANLLWSIAWWLMYGSESEGAAGSTGDAAWDRELADILASARSLAQPAVHGCSACCRRTTEEGAPLLICSRCRSARFCCVECQKVAWSAMGHKQACKGLAAAAVGVERA